MATHKERFIFSTSTFGTVVKPEVALPILQLVQAKAVLVSAYDIELYQRTDAAKFKDVIGGILDVAKTSEIYIDSGNYESSRYHDANWTQDKFENIVSILDKGYYYFSYDSYDWFESEADAIKNLSASIERLAKRGISFERIIPVLHIAGQVDLVKLARIMKTIRYIKNNYGSCRVAIPERDIGAGVRSRVLSVRLIVAELEKHGIEIDLHLLGTGNPLSIYLFADAGATSFDGLEWCRQSMDHRGSILYHPSHYDFFSEQLTGESDQVNNILKNPDVDFNLRFAVHNACAMKYIESKICDNGFSLSAILESSYTKRLAEKIRKAVA